MENANNLTRPSLEARLTANPSLPAGLFYTDWEQYRLDPELQEKVHRMAGRVKCETCQQWHVPDGNLQT